MTRLSKLSRSLHGRVAIVTGAGSGMGRATAHLLGDEGAKVAVVDVNRDGVDRVAGELAAAGYPAKGYVADLSDPAQIEALVPQVRADLGPIDIVVNNAGVSIPTTLTAQGWEDAWALTFEVNLTAQARLIRACHEDLTRAELAADGGGRVVNIASTEEIGRAHV